MTQKSELGKLGEDKACEYLKGKGYKVVDRNYRMPFGELDIVAMAPDKTLVLVEVKTMGEGEIVPEDQMTKAKLVKFSRICQFYASKYNDKLVNSSKGWRADVLALTVSKENCKIIHYENVL